MSCLLFSYNHGCSTLKSLFMCSPPGDCVIENDTTNTALDFPEDELVTEKSIYTAEYTYKGYPVNLVSTCATRQSQNTIASL